MPASPSAARAPRHGRPQLSRRPAPAAAVTAWAAPQCSVTQWRGSVGPGGAAPARRAVRPGLRELLLTTGEEDCPDQEEPGEDEHDGGERIHERQVHPPPGEHAARDKT